MTHVGIIGGGNISETHARAASELEGVRVVAVHGQNRAKAERLAHTYGGDVYEDLDSLLAHSPLEVVLVGSPSGLHAEQGIAAARRGLHVLVEKPLDVTVERADALIEECEKANVKLGVFFQDRVASDVRGLKDLVETGRLGRPPVPTDARWRGTWALDGGGALMNQGVHTLDLLLWLLGDVKSVCAKTATALHDIEVEDTVVATLEFENGAVGTLEATTAAYPGYPRRVELTGTGGTVILEGSSLVAADLRTPLEGFVFAEVASGSSPAAPSPVVSDVSGHKEILSDFLRSIETGGTPICDGREGRRSVELARAVYESSRTGQAVRLGRWA